MTADITLRGPGDVVTVLPYQLGYHPRDCVVVVTLLDRRLGLVVRCDLPAEGEEEATASTLVGPLVRDGATSVIVVGYEDVVDAAHPLLLALVEQLERAGLDVVDAVVVRDGRRYSPLCAEPCCPPEGVALPSPADVPGVAEFVALGRSPLPSRQSVHALVAPEPARCSGVAEAIAGNARRPGARRRSAAAWGLLLGGAGASSGPEPGRRSQVALAVESVADLVVGLDDVAWRDGLIAWLAPGVLPADELDDRVVATLRCSLPTWGDMGLGASGVTGPRREPTPSRRRRREVAAEREALLELLLEVCRSVPDDCPREAAAVCTVTAHVAWCGGDGAVTRVALERALRLDPAYRLAMLLERLVDHGVRFPMAGRRGLGTDAVERAG